MQREQQIVGRLTRSSSQIIRHVYVNCAQVGFRPLALFTQDLISQRLACFERERHAFLRFLFAAERNEGFAL